jgi:hypothetical protein
MTVVDVIRKKLKEQADNIGIHLATGQPVDYSAYRDVVGQLRSMNLAIAIIDEVLKTSEDADNAS